MADNACVVNSTVSDNIDLLCCNICYENYTSPRILPCLHSFCQDCLQKHVDVSVARANEQQQSTSGISHDESTFSCPTCRECITLPSTGVIGFRRDFRIQQMQDFVRETTVALKANPDIADASFWSYCQFCRDHYPEPRSISFCKDCSKNICESCASKHVRLTIFADHHILNPHASRPGTNMELCASHDQELLNYFCVTCVKAICALCVMNDDHDDHTIISLQAGLHNLKEVLSSHNTSLNSRLSNLNHIYKKLQSTEGRVNSIRAKVTEEVERQTEEMIQEVQMHQVEILGRLNKRCNSEIHRSKSTSKQIQTIISNMINLTELVDSLLKQDINPNMLPLYKDLNEHIDSAFDENLAFKLKSIGIFDVRFFKTTNMLSVGHLSFNKAKKNSILSLRAGETNALSIENEVIIPRPVDDICEMQLIVKFGKHGIGGGEFDSPRDLCFLQDSKLLVVADTNNNRIQVFNCSGLLMNVLAAGEIKPWGITHTHDGCIAVTDNLGKCVKIYDPISGHLKHKMGRFICPCGICSTSSGGYILTDFFSTDALVLDQNGAVLDHFQFRFKTDQHMCGASRVATTNEGRIIISDISNACLKVFSRKGRLILRIKKPEKMLSPQGLVVDQEGRILVLDSVKKQVVLWSQEGQYLGSLLHDGSTNSSARLRDPTGLDICGNILALTQMKNNQVRLYHLRYLNDK